MNTTYVATAGLETAPLQDGSVLYNLKTGKFIMLNRSAAFLWAELSTPVTSDALVDRLGRAFTGSRPDAVQVDVSQALSQFKGLELASARDHVAESQADAVPVGTGQAVLAPTAYESPMIRVLDEDELLNIFQMTAAEISVASCWWAACAGSIGCP